MRQVTHLILCLKLGHSTEADASSSSPVKTMKRTFSLLQSTTRGESSVGPTIPFHQIISLVSMTSPRTFGPHRVYASPAFVEFDMSESGYGWVPILAGVGGLYLKKILKKGNYWRRALGKWSPEFNTSHDVYCTCAIHKIIKHTCCKI